MRIGPHPVVRLLGQGGMAQVFLARAFGASGFERHIAIKILREELRGDVELERLIIAEARVGARLAHRNLVPVEDLGIHEGTYFLKMPYVPGVTLRALGRADAPLAAYVAEEIALGLLALHRASDGDGRPLGLVHRDVTPTNILCSTSGEVRLADYGVVKATARAAVTRGNLVKGKVAYLSPEQVRGEPLGAASDHFSLGVTLVELITGARPFDGETPHQTMQRIEAAEPPHLSSLPPSLATIFARCLARDPAARFDSDDALVAALAAARRELAPAGPTELATQVQKTELAASPVV
jgi:serine/threonine-protein kinase